MNGKIIKKEEEDDNAIREVEYSNFMSRQLHVDLSFYPIRQKRRDMAPKKQEAVLKEVGKLLKAQSIRKVQYPDRLAKLS